jgi:hypothetical protein
VRNIWPQAKHPYAKVNKIESHWYTLHYWSYLVVGESIGSQCQSVNTDIGCTDTHTHPVTSVSGGYK